MLSLLVCTVCRNQNENKVHANNRWFAVKKKTPNIKN